MQQNRPHQFQNLFPETSNFRAVVMYYFIKRFLHIAPIVGPWTLNSV